MPSNRRSLSPAQVAECSEVLFRASERECVGMEIEWPVHHRGDVHARPDLAEMAAVEAIGLPAGGKITFEPGGQVELSSAPHRSVGRLLEAMDADSRALSARMRSMGLLIEILAVDQRRAPQRVLQKGRYQAMEEFFSSSGSAGKWMMCNTTSVQLNISHDPVDPHHRWYTMHCAGPSLIAAFANSPGIDGAGRRWASMRQGIWWSMDPGRTCPVRTDIPPEKAWVDYALAADVMLVLGSDPTGADGRGLAPGLPFGKWMSDGHELGWPTAADLRYHFTTLFPPVRPRGWLELRVLDALPAWIREVALLVVASACTEGASAELRDRLPNLSALWHTAAREAMDHPVLADAACILFEVALEHLDEVSTETAHRDQVVEYQDRFVRRRKVPGGSPGSRRRAPAPLLAAG